MKIIYSAMGGTNDPMFGKFEQPIKMLIEQESDACEKKKDEFVALFNIEKSNRFSETVMGESDFSTFRAKKEGQRAENDSVEKTYHKTIEHVEYAKEFTITRKMADDAKMGIGAEFKRIPKAFIRSYYRTRVELAMGALINGTKGSFNYGGEDIDITTGDGLSLFHNQHPYAKADMKNKPKQSNYYYGDLCSSSAKLEETLAVLANKLRNFKDENGRTLGYIADTIVIPSNRPKLEMMVKKIIGSERTVGSDNNDINTQYGNWKLVIVTDWETEDDRFMIMSSEANKYLLGNIFYNRVALDITSDVDKHTRNYFWNGYCRFGVGFNTWKHILLAVNSTSAVANATQLA